MLGQEQAVNELLKRYEICTGLFHRFDWSKYFTGTAQEKLNVLPRALEHILAQEDGKKRLLQAVRELSLSVTTHWCMFSPASPGAAPSGRFAEPSGYEQHRKVPDRG